MFEVGDFGRIHISPDEEMTLATCPLFQPGFNAHPVVAYAASQASTYMPSTLNQFALVGENHNNTRT